MPVPLRVVSVEGSVFEGEVDGNGRPFLIARGADGDLGVLPQHSPLLTTLRPGLLEIRNGSEVTELFCGGGFLEVLPDRVTVLADVAERADEISEEAAEAARQRAADRLAGELSSAEKADMTTALEIADARLRLARMRRGVSSGGR
ncbi:MAG: ATP synthase F1 subunit epsilon [Candidatus Dormiibacterota bacterium]